MGATTAPVEPTRAARACSLRARVRAGSPTATPSSTVAAPAAAARLGARPSGPPRRRSGRPRCANPYRRRRRGDGGGPSCRRSRGDVGEGEAALLLGHAGVEHDLEKQIAELVAERRGVVSSPPPQRLRRLPRWCKARSWRRSVRVSQGQPPGPGSRAMIASNRSRGRLIGLSGGQSLFQEEALVIRRVVERAVNLVPEARIKLRTLKRKRVEHRRVAAELYRASLCQGQQLAPDAATTQIGMHPKLGDKQPAGVCRADEAGHDLAVVSAHEKAHSEKPVSPEKLTRLYAWRARPSLSQSLADGRSSMVSRNPAGRSTTLSFSCAMMPQPT